MMEAVQASETSVNLYQSTRRYNPEDSHFLKIMRKYTNWGVSSELVNKIRLQPLCIQNYVIEFV
jgi:hypothetical protein